MNSQDIAETLNTSPSSIIRFSKKITEGGFHELKIGLSKVHLIMRMKKLTIRLSIKYATYLNKPRQFLSMVMAHHL